MGVWFWQKLESHGVYHIPSFIVWTRCHLATARWICNKWYHVFEQSSLFCVNCAAGNFSATCSHSLKWQASPLKMHRKHSGRMMHPWESCNVPNGVESVCFPLTHRTTAQTRSQNHHRVHVQPHTNLFFNVILKNSGRDVVTDMFIVYSYLIVLFHYPITISFFIPFMFWHHDNCSVSYYICIFWFRVGALRQISFPAGLIKYFWFLINKVLLIPAPPRCSSMQRVCSRGATGHLQWSSLETRWCCAQNDFTLTVVVTAHSLAGWLARSSSARCLLFSDDDRSYTRLQVKYLDQKILEYQWIYFHLHAFQYLMYIFDLLTNKNMLHKFPWESRGEQEKVNKINK